MSTPTYVMVLDHVLRKPSTNSVITQGQSLYAALATTGRLAILCGEDEDMADWFLRTNGFIKHTHLIPLDKQISPTNSGRRMAQIRSLRTQRAHIEFVIEPDPEIALELYKNGIPVLAYLHPQFTQPAFRPDYSGSARPWEDLTKEVEYQIEMRAKTIYDNEDLL